MKVWNFDFLSKIHDSNRLNIWHGSPNTRQLFIIRFTTGVNPAFERSSRLSQKCIWQVYSRVYRIIGQVSLTFCSRNKNLCPLHLDLQNATSRIGLRVWDWINLIVGRFERSRWICHDDIEDKWIVFSSDFVYWNTGSFFFFMNSDTCIFCLKMCASTHR